MHYWIRFQFQYSEFLFLLSQFWGKFFTFAQGEAGTLGIKDICKEIKKISFEHPRDIVLWQRGYR